MQDRICQVDQTLLQRAAGPYIWVKSVAFRNRQPRLDFRYTPLATELAALQYVAMGP